MVVFTGQVPTSAIGTDAFQEADVIGISRACTKWNVMVKNVAELPKRIKEAFEIATSGRPGPVLVDLPKDMQASILRSPIPIASTLPSHPSAATLAARDLSRKQLDGAIKRVADLINIAKKPVLYCGQGVVALPEGPKLLKELADKASIPVTTTLQAVGAFNEHDEKSLRMLGMHGFPAANMAMQEADLIIALGARFDDRVTGNIAKFAPQAKLAASQKRGGIVHFEIMPKNINKVVQATEAVEGDVATNLATLLPLVKPKPSRPEWFSQINDWKTRLPFAYEKETPDGLIKPQAVIEKLSKLTEKSKDRTIITTGVGQHQMWVRIDPFILMFERSIGTEKYRILGCPILPLDSSSHHGHLRRPRHYGLWPTRRHRRQSRFPRCPRHRHRRRRLLQHDPHRTQHRCPVQHWCENHHTE